MVIVAALLVLVAALAFRFMPHRKPPAVRNEEAAGTQAIDRKEGIRHREYKDGKVWADLRADRFYLGADGKNHLEGAVEITDYGREEGRETRISADAVVYDKEMTRFTLSGHVRVAGGGLVFETAALVYDKTRGLYVAEKGGAFSSDALAGSGRIIEYNEKSDEIRLAGAFRLEVKPGGAAPQAVELNGDSLVYDRTARKGVAEGRARLVSGDAEGTAERLTFALSDDERVFREASFEKSAKCVFKGGPGERRTIEAAAVRIVPAPGTSRASRVEAEGACVLTLVAPSGPSGTVRADRARLEFADEGKLAGWKAEGGARMSVDEGKDAAREAAGESLSFSGPDGLLTLSAGTGEAARLEDARSRVEAREVGLDATAKDFQASGAVRCLLKSRPGGVPVGFFSGGEAVFVTAGLLRSSDGGGLLRFEGEVRAWQGEASLQAAALEVVEGTGEVRGRGGVSATLPWPAKDPAEKRSVEAGGQDMTYSPSGRTVLFRGAGFVRAPRARLTAETVTISLLEGKKELKDLRAWGEVVVSLDRYEGRGGQAVYEPGAETLVLTGAPVLVEKGRGETKGDKLTFRLADDKILIENKGQGRSITDIKS
jgi:lipopolysaccharide export system protein LptA